MLRQTVPTVRRGALARVALMTIVALASVVAGCGTSATTMPTPTPPASATPTPTGFHALVVTHALTGAGTVVQQTELAAIDPVTGHQLWARAVMGHPGPFVPARAGNTVVASVGIQASPYPASQVSAFDLRTGAGLWDHNFGPNTQAFVGSSGSSIIVVTSAVSTEAPGATLGLTVAALNPADGAQLWQHTLPNQEIYAPIQATGTAVYLLGGQPTGADTSYTLTALNAATGAPLWQKTLGTGTILGTLTDAGAYYVGLYPAHLVAAIPGARAGALALPAQSPFAASTLTAYRASDGAQLWQASGFAAPQAEAGGTLYATSATLDSSGRLDFAMLALKAATGARLWQSSQLGVGDPASKPFAVADANGVYAIAMPGATSSVQALRAATGAPLWSALPSTTAQAGAAGLGSVFAATVPATPAGQAPQPANVTIAALSASTGAVQWTLVVEQSQTATLVLA